MVGFPDKKERERALKKLQKVEGSLALNANETVLEKFRFDLCQKFLIFKNVHALSQIELALLLGTDAAKVSKILHHRIHEFSTDRLIELYLKLEPDLKLRVG
jgi:predicted XRE-type DNA-binding protein